MTEKGAVEEQSSRERLADDAVLAAVALAIVVGIGFAAEVDVHTPTLLAAAGGIVVLELLLSTKPSRVRAVWERSYVRPLAVTAAVLVAVAGAFVAPPLVFALLWGGLGGYLLLAGTILLLSGPPFGRLLARFRANGNDEK
ncbi:hypothetical protein [Haloarchaeobius iranensis]|uniref:Uncharacterized protein n=1 Tax=Haloarchaeobius iranensis TaxID=996166 RepID=A0A1G9WW82_9EURY|nr:hypothetical protein [Haloarchaeobius iranensis]SDM88864.1 hypothetical protein SAMN05192554_10923 [Haloarchaeobius iranensis]